MRKYCWRLQYSNTVKKCVDGAGEEPIIFHQPVNNVLKWSTSIESGICMANLCEDWVDVSFWRRAYNLSSGTGYRVATWNSKLHAWVLLICVMVV